MSDADRIADRLWELDHEQALQQIPDNGYEDALAFTDTQRRIIAQVLAEELARIPRSTRPTRYR